MNMTSSPKKMSYILLTGVLIISFTLFLGQFTTLPDFAIGALMGVGIGLEMIALYKLAGYRKNKCY